MLKKCLEEATNKGYVLNFHYNPTLRELQITAIKACETGKCAGMFMSADYLSDDEKIVYVIQQLINQLEEK